MILPQGTTNETNIKLPLSFIIFSLISFAASQVILLFAGEPMIDGVFRIPSLWAAAHLLVLGWALMVAMGAMYQLVPVAFLTPIWNERFGFIQFWISAIGVTGLALTLYFQPRLSMYTGGIAVLGILLFLFQMYMTIKKQPEKNIFTLFVGSALACLLLTIALGVLLTINIGIGIRGLNHLFILKSHIVLGITGWFTLLIFGFSYKMVPMFSLAHGFSMILSKAVYIVYGVGLLTTITSFYFTDSFLFQIGLFGLFLGFTLFSYHIFLIIKVRLKKKLDKPFIFSLLAIGTGEIIHLAGLILSFFPSQYDYFGILIYLYIFGWIVFSIVGYLYKIVPFLWWTHRYSKEIGKKDVPTLKEMINDKVSIPLFLLFGIGIVGNTVAMIFKSSLAFYISQSILMFVTLWFAFIITAVIRK